jgi:hypothetical protein
MRAYLEPLCRLAPYVALALLGIFGLIDTPIMIAMVVVLTTTWRGGRSCLPGKA